MTVSEVRQRPLRLGRLAKHDVRTQFGVVPWRRHEGRVEVLLVTSRKAGRWGIPKGWPADGATPSDAAAREAWEEAGATGLVSPVCLGIYTYAKKGVRRMRLPCVVAVFPMHVRRLAARWPEHGERQRLWTTPAKAARLVDNPELARLLEHFAPDPGMS